MEGILLINKPAGYTSHDVVNIVRKNLHTKKVGHAGTLDPDAKGLLVVCVGKATKVLQFLTLDMKEYIATLSLGKSTDTYDASGKVIEEAEVKDLSEEKIYDVIHSFLGKSKQIPPMYSAIKVNGKKLYQYAREGKAIEIEPRDIEIYEIEVLNIDHHEIQFRCLCSKGTYIRSLCVDIANKLGYPGHMSDLTRTRSGNYTLDQSFTLDELHIDIPLLPIETALSSYPKIIVEDEKDIINGKKIVSELNTRAVVYNKEGKALAVYEPCDTNLMRSVRGLW